MFVCLFGEKVGTLLLSCLLEPMSSGETRFREVSVFLHATCSVFFFFRESAFFYRFWVFVKDFFFFFSRGGSVEDIGLMCFDLIQFLTIRASPPRLSLIVV